MVNPTVIISGTLQPQMGRPGMAVLFTYKINYSEPPNGGPHPLNIQIHYGDGTIDNETQTFTGEQTFQKTHIYNTLGNFHPNITVMDWAEISHQFSFPRVLVGYPTPRPVVTSASASPAGMVWSPMNIGIAVVLVMVVGIGIGVLLTRK